MSVVSYKVVVIVTATIVKPPERFKLRGSLIGYLPLLVSLAFGSKINQKMVCVLQNKFSTSVRDGLLL